MSLRSLLRVAFGLAGMAAFVISTAVSAQAATKYKMLVSFSPGVITVDKA